MANVIKGTFTLRQVLQQTYTKRFKSRFVYKLRDVLKKVDVIKETKLSPDRPGEPTVTYIFRSYSYPNYSPYNDHTTSKRQRKNKHQYDQVLSMETDKDGKFSMDSTQWRYRLGSQKKWQDNVPQNKVKTIYRTTSAKWKAEYEKECSNIKKKNVNKEKKLAEAKKKLDKKKESHKKLAPYLDSGDYNSRVNGVNGDFYYRAQGAFQYWGHLYGRNSNPGSVDTTNVFAPKHMLALVEYLIKIGILV